MSEAQRPPLPPFTFESAVEKVRLAKLTLMAITRPLVISRIEDLNFKRRQRLAYLRFTLLEAGAPFALKKSFSTSRHLSYDGCSSRQALTAGRQV
jgi:hypothetical protein